MVGSTINCIQLFKIQAGTQLKPVFGGFETRLKFIKFGHLFCYIYVKKEGGPCLKVN